LLDSLKLDSNVKKKKALKEDGKDVVTTKATIVDQKIDRIRNVQDSQDKIDVENDPVPFETTLVNLIRVAILRHGDGILGLLGRDLVHVEKDWSLFGFWAI